MDDHFIGVGSIRHLRTIIEKLDPQKIMVVTGKESYVQSGAKREVEHALGRRKYQRYFDFELNPKFEELVKGAHRVKEIEPDVIIAVGGGSVIDTAKTISILADDETEAKKILEGKAVPGENHISLIVIPTTFGTGSEATNSAVVFCEGQKYSISSPYILPDYVIVDPRFSYSLSPFQAAVSGMDALSQSIESYWAKSSNDESREYSLKALEYILPNIVKAVKENDTDSRNAMALGAYYSGRAIDISKTTAAHALAYTFTINYGIPHGQAVANMIPFVYELNLKKSTDEDPVRVLDSIIKKMVGQKNIVQYLKNLVDILDLNMQYDDENIDMLIESINMERLSNNPYEYTNNEIENIYKYISKKYNV